MSMPSGGRDSVEPSVNRSGSTESRPPHLIVYNYLLISSVLLLCRRILLCFLMDVYCLISYLYLMEYRAGTY